LILAHPVWKDELWYKLLEKIAIKTYHVEQGTPVFYTDKKVLLPSPNWQTAITLIDTTQKNVTNENLDPHIVGALLKIDRGFGREKLEKAVRLYPWVPPLSQFSLSIQTDFQEKPARRKDKETQISQDDRGKIAQEVQAQDFQVSTIFEHPEKFETPWIQQSVEDLIFDLIQEVDLSFFQEFHDDLTKNIDKYTIQTLDKDLDDEIPRNPSNKSRLATPRAHFPINSKDIQCFVCT